MMKQIIYLFLLILLTACPDNYEFEYDIVITDTPTNLDGLNSSYDDFNSDLPYDYGGMDIYFSSNRNSKGNNFDIIAKGLSFSYHSKDDILDLKIRNEQYFNNETDSLFKMINTENDELGPFSFFTNDMLFMYATDLKDTFKIKLVDYKNWNNSREPVISGPTDIPVINDVGNNLYPSFNPGDSKMLFCSDRNNSVFDIYSAVYNSEISAETLLNGAIKSIQKEDVLSSLHDDKCPFILGNRMVFTSNRDGGPGGYDLYYSFFENGSWTSPQLFENNINSASDEYRPVIFHMLGYNLMIFSSNRPGGKGGYDLYIVNIDKIIK